MYKSPKYNIRNCMYLPTCIIFRDNFISFFNAREGLRLPKTMSSIIQKRYKVSINRFCSKTKKLPNVTVD